MPRPLKVGLDYFPLDVNFFSNKKIKALRRAFGATGIAVYLNILCRVYSSGYYYRFTSEEDLVADIAEDVSNGRFRSVIACVADVIRHLIENGIIDKTFYERDLVITGKAMQEQYALSASKAKRKIDFGIYQLVDVLPTIPENKVSSEETPVNSEETPVNSEFSTQSKVNKNKENITLQQQTDTRARDGEIEPIPNALDVLAYFSKYGIEDGDQIDRFISYNNKREWDCLPDWKKAARQWMRQIPRPPITNPNYKKGE